MAVGTAVNERGRLTFDGLGEPSRSPETGTASWRTQRLPWGLRRRCKQGPNKSQSPNEAKRVLPQRVGSPGQRSDGEKEEGSLGHDWTDFGLNAVVAVAGSFKGVMASSFLNHDGWHDDRKGAEDGNQVSQ